MVRGHSNKLTVTASAKTRISEILIDSKQGTVCIEVIRNTNGSSLHVFIRGMARNFIKLFTMMEMKQILFCPLQALYKHSINCVIITSHVV